MGDYIETAALNEIESVEARREVERLRPMLEEARAKLAEVTAQLDETRRELAQTLASERAVRRLVITAEYDKRRVVATDEVRAAMDGAQPEG